MELRPSRRKAFSWYGEVPTLKLDDSQIQHLRRAQEFVAKAHAEVLAASMPVSSTSPAIMIGLLSARDLLKALLQQASDY
jgi:hypothetical protein